MNRSNTEPMIKHLSGLTFLLFSFQISFCQDSLLQSIDEARALSVSVMEDFYSAQFSSSFENMSNYMPVTN